MLVNCSINIVLLRSLRLVKRARVLNQRSSTLAVIALALIALSFIVAPSTAVAAPQKRTHPRRAPKASIPPKPKIDYARFSHQTHVATQKLACTSCHKVPSKNWKEMRKGDAAFADVTDFPEHSSCLNCHRPQFFARERPAPTICSNCHLAVTPRDTARWLFPSLGDVTDPKLKRREFVSEFGVGFPHDKHIDVVGFNSIPFRGGLPATASGSSPTLNDFALVAVSFQTKKPAPPKSCPVCHETYQPQGNSSEEFVTKPPKNIGDVFWLKKGTLKTIPNSHTICFTCHNTDSGIAPEPKNCEMCHKLVAPMQTKVDFDPKLPATMGITDKMILARWSRRVSSGAFRHEGGEHPDLSCLNCHTVAMTSFSTLDQKTQRVPVRSCGGADGCHITATTGEGGALNFEIDSRKKDPTFVCTKCHVTFGKEPLPENHPQAVPTPRPKAKTS